MTAFGRAGCALVAWEIRSVNHRYLELGFRLPDQLRDLERRLRELALRRIRRGKVDATLRLATAEITPEINAKAVEHLLAAVDAIRRQAPSETIGPVNPLDLMRFPGVLADLGGDIDALKAAAIEGFEAALDDLVEHRASEGANLAALLGERLAEVERIVAAVRALIADHGDYLRDRLLDRVQALTTSVDEDRLEQEVALLVHKADVAEELDRLEIHVGEARTSLAGEEPCGRRLDFLMQELGREANTLAAKSILPDAARLAVDLKVVIEQMREQVQNVE
ncbi:MAG: YicC family protein [Gammaproteobacteria bacterium]|nr:YicC family protein [Gammaproteobacteria bacterium]